MGLFSNTESTKHINMGTDWSMYSNLRYQNTQPIKRTALEKRESERKVARLQKLLFVEQQYVDAQVAIINSKLEEQCELARSADMKCIHYILPREYPGSGEVRYEVVHYHIVQLFKEAGYLVQSYTTKPKHGFTEMDASLHHSYMIVIAWGKYYEAYFKSLQDTNTASSIKKSKPLPTTHMRSHTQPEHTHLKKKLIQDPVVSDNSNTPTTRHYQDQKLKKQGNIETKKPTITIFEQNIQGPGIRKHYSAFKPISMGHEILLEKLK